MKSMRYTMLVSLWFIAPLGAKPAAPAAQTVKHVAEKKVDASPAQLLQSIQKELRDAKYRQEILPNNFSYPLQLLEYGVKTNQSRDYTQSVFRLFSKLLKGAEYVNAYVFSAFVEQFPSLLKKQFTIAKPEFTTQQLATHDLDVLDRLEHNVSTIVYGKFTNDFSKCKEDPQNFLDDLTKQIVAAASEELTTKQLRQTTLHFLEVGLSKLVWSPMDMERSWESVKTLSRNLAELIEHNIVDDIDDLDELFWTLTHRYCFFLEINGADMPLPFYTKVKHDIATQQLLLFDLEEQEPFLQSKSDCIMSTLLAQEAKKRAAEHQSIQQRVF